MRTLGTPQQAGNELLFLKTCFVVLSLGVAWLPAWAQCIQSEDGDIVMEHMILRRDGDRLMALPKGCGPEEIRDFFLQLEKEKVPSHGEDGAQLLADMCGKAAIPPLLDLLRPEMPHVAKQSALLCLGKIGDPASVRDLVRFIEKPKRLPYKEAGDLLTFAIAALAFIGNDSALEYINRMMSEEYWTKRKASAAYVDEAWLREETTKGRVRKFTVDALSFSGMPRAREVLLDLKANPAKCPASEAAVLGALEHWEARAALRKKREGRSAPAE